MSKEITDKELIEAVKTGDTEAFDQLIERHAGKLYQAAYGLLSNREDAEEVVQDAFVRAYKAIDGFRGDASFETWIYRIVVNLSRNKYQWNRRRGAELNVSLTQQANRLEDEDNGEEMMIPDASYEPDKVLEGVELEDSIMDSFEKLPDKIKETMILRHVNEFSYEKIADLLQCKVGTVKSRIARGREILRGILLGMDNAGAV
jgi:RNA polymerase sigma-70 factor (ECF subfamily)